MAKHEYKRASGHWSLSAHAAVDTQPAHGVRVAVGSDGLVVGERHAWQPLLLLWIATGPHLMKIRQRTNMNKRTQRQS